MTAASGSEAELPPPFLPPFTRADKRRRTIFVPNLSRSFSVLSAAVFRGAGFKAEPLPLADEEALKLGKRYMHNDICYPAQINIGEMLRHLSLNGIPGDQAAIALAKNCPDCRAGQYSVLARKALDDAGYADAAIVTTGDDTKKMHPGFNASMGIKVGLAWGIVIGDALDAMVRRTRPYEVRIGSVDRLYDEHIDKIAAGLQRSVGAGLKALAQAVAAFNAVPVDQSHPRPRVLVIGEILMNYHDPGNRQLVRYLEKHGMEVILPEMLTFFHREVVIKRDAVKRGLSKTPLGTTVEMFILDKVYRHVKSKVARGASHFRLYEPPASVSELARNIDGFVDRTFSAGEGWLIPAEIIEYAKKGVSSFIIIQPFGCLPNQITGRGIMKTLKERLPHINLLALDYDYDVSMANIENRLQMLVMTAKGLMR